VANADPIRPLQLAVLISGGGTTLLNLIRKIHAQELAAQIQLVVSSDPRAGGLQYAQQAQIPGRVVSRREFATTEAFSTAIFRLCREAQVDLVAMGGFLKHVLVPPDFAGRVMNIHPSLIPAFCGPGFYGSKVHQAVLDYGCKVSGCTVHFVDNEYDHGPIILQRVVPVLDGDTAGTLAKRVFEQECQAYPEALQLYGQRRLRLEGRRVSRA
jgi:phosphoribosylglycinamide formyltransferase 1